MPETPLSPRVKPPAARLATMATAIALPVAGLAALLVSGQADVTTPRSEAIIWPSNPKPYHAPVLAASPVAEGIALDGDSDADDQAAVAHAAHVVPVSIHPPRRIVRAVPRSIPVPVAALPPVETLAAQPQATQPQPAQTPPAPSPQNKPASDSCSHARSHDMAPHQWHICRHGEPTMPAPSTPTSQPPAAPAQET